MDLGRSMIPTLAPNWTDQNIHDPGIMLMELVAWIAEAQMYSMDRLRRDERAAYAGLLGVEPRGPLLPRDYYGRPIPAQPPKVSWSSEGRCYRAGPSDRAHLLRVLQAAVDRSHADARRNALRGTGTSTTRPWSTRSRARRSCPSATLPNRACARSHIPVDSAG